VVRLRKQALKRRKVKQIEQLQQTLMLNPHNPSRNEENAQKLKQNEFLPVMRTRVDLTLSVLSMRRTIVFSSSIVSASTFVIMSRTRKL
jgi:hypothetical protein